MEVSKQKALDALRAATRQPLKDENAAWSQIVRITEKARLASEDPTLLLRDWVYAIAVVYTQQTGLVPAFSNADNETRFERFIHALPRPPGVSVTAHRVKTAIRYWDFKRNERFLACVDKLPQY